MIDKKRQLAIAAEVMQADDLEPARARRGRILPVATAVLFIAVVVELVVDVPRPARVVVAVAGVVICCAWVYRNWGARVLRRGGEQAGDDR